MGALRKLQNSIQTLVIFWPVYPIHTNSLFWVTFEELSFCHFLPPNTSIRGKDSQISVDLSFEHLSFSSKRKTTILFPSPLTFLQWPIWKVSCGELRDCFTRCTSPRLVAKREQIVCMASCEFNELAAKPKCVAQSRPALYSYSQRVNRAS